MRVLVLTTTLPRRSGDGTPSFVLDQLRELAKDHDLSVLAPRVAGTPPHQIVDGIEVRRFRYYPSRWESLADDAILPQLRQKPWMAVQVAALACSMLAHALLAARREQPDVIWGHWVLPAGAIALIAGRLAGKPVLVTSHGSDAFSLNIWPLPRIKRLVARRCDALVVVSTEVGRRLGAAERAIVQPAGVDAPLWQGLVGQRQPSEEDVLFVGRLARNKGPHLAIRAIADHPHLKLRIVGDGPERKSLEDQARELGVADRVTFLGRCTREQVAAEYRRAAVLVIPSIVGPDGSQEGTPSVLGEAATVGLPVIASRLSGMAEFLTHDRTGLLFEPGDIAALSRELGNLFTEPGLAQRISSESQEALAPQLSLGKATKTYSKLLRELGHSSRGQSRSLGSRPPRTARRPKP